MQEQLGLNIVLFKIKDTEFDFTPYGLTDRYFRIDVTDNINASKSVKFTEYPLIDGTTRIDTVSRAPGTLSFQGKIGDVFSSPDYTHTIKSSGGKTRMQLSIELLENLRDDAVVLDVLTQSKTFENYLIESVSFTNERFGINTVNFTLREFLAFGDDLSDIVESTEGNPTGVAEFQVRSLSTNNFTTDEEMINEVYRLITDPDISPAYVIRIGSLDINPDVFINPIRVENLPYLDKTREQGQTAFTYTYNTTRVAQDLDMQVLTSGLVKNNLKIKLDIEKISTGDFTNPGNISMVSRDLTPNPEEFTEVPKYKISVQLFKRIDGEDIPVDPPINIEDVMISPRFSNIDKGFNPFEGNATIDNDPITKYGTIEAHYYATCFLRKYKTFAGLSSNYKAIPNLLRNIDKGYLYPTFYYTSRRIPKRGVRYYLNIGFVYLHPDFAKAIKQRFTEDAASFSDHLLKGKNVIWW